MRVSDIPEKVQMFKERGQKAQHQREGLLETDDGQTIAVIACGQSSDGEPLWLHVIDEKTVKSEHMNIDASAANCSCFVALQDDVDFLRNSRFMALDLAKLACIRDKIEATMVATDGRTCVDFELGDGSLLRVSFRPMAKDWRHNALKFLTELKGEYVGEIHVDDALLCEDRSQVLALASVRNSLSSAARCPNTAFKLLHEAQSRTAHEQDAELAGRDRPGRRRETQLRRPLRPTRGMPRSG